MSSVTRLYISFDDTFTLDDLERAFHFSLKDLTETEFKDKDRGSDGSDNKTYTDVDYSIALFEHLFRSVGNSLDKLLAFLIDFEEQEGEKVELEGNDEWVARKVEDVDAFCQSLLEVAESTSAQLSLHHTPTDGDRLLDSLRHIINEDRRVCLIRLNKVRVLPLPAKYIVGSRDLDSDEANATSPKSPKSPAGEEKNDFDEAFVFPNEYVKNEYAPKVDEKDETELVQVRDEGGLYCKSITISRDQTNSSDFRKDLLIFLRESRLEWKFRLGEFFKSTPRLSGVSGEQLQLYRMQQIQAQEAQIERVRQGGPDPPPPARIGGPPPDPPSNNSFRPPLPAIPFSPPSDPYREFFQTEPSYPIMDLGQSSTGPPVQLQNSDKYEKITSIRHEPNGIISPGSKPELRTEYDAPQEDDSLRQLLDRISSLEEENKTLMATHDSHPCWVTLHVIRDGDGPNARNVNYLEEPTWAIGPRGEFALKAHFPVTDVEGYLRQKQGVAFSIAKFYSTTHQQEEVQRAVRDKTPLPRPRPLQESIRFESVTMIAAAEDFFRRQPKFSTEFPNFNIKFAIPAPYLFWYHYRNQDAFQDLSLIHREHMQLLCGWIDEHYGAMYDRVNEQLSRKVVSYETMPFLAKPGDVLVSKDAGKWRAHVATSWPSNQNRNIKPPSIQETAWASSSTPAGLTEASVTSKWTIQAWSYKYDGRFYRSKSTVDINLKASSMQEEVKMEELNIVPLKYASKEAEPILKKRGESFWSCRNRRLVSYMDENGTYGSV